MGRHGHSEPGSLWYRDRSANTFYSSKPRDQRGVCEAWVVRGGERVRAESCGKQSGGKVHRQRRIKVAS